MPRFVVRIIPAHGRFGAAVGRPDVDIPRTAGDAVRLLAQMSGIAITRANPWTRRVERAPYRAAAQAATQPAGPPPQTTTSYSPVTGMSRAGS